MAQVSNPYLSQVERGVHQPSVRVLRGIAEALDVSRRRCWSRQAC
jgi:transcriptional regulator with XRE-family HTH domain